VHWLRVGSCRHPEWVTLRGGSWRVVDFPAHCALILHPSVGPILYDTGYADRFFEETTPFPARLYRWITPMMLPRGEALSTQLARHGVQLSDVTRVLISHLHADHVAGLRDLPRARFTALKEDVNANLGQQGWGALMRGFLPGLLPDDFATRVDFADDCPVRYLGPSWAPFDRGFDLIGDGSLVGIPLPGHSPAQLGLVMWLSDGQPLMLVADACWSSRARRELRLPSPLARPMLADWHQYAKTLSGLHALGKAMPHLDMLPSHCREGWTPRSGVTRA
jgi:glyoxylase-like metal-dependent hydrolase (beta-lactamase superfamily II)